MMIYYNDLDCYLPTISCTNPARLHWASRMERRRRKPSLWTLEELVSNTTANAAAAKDLAVTDATAG